ncbi:2-amino-4-hydroxy-6-hydroxymethyldihydropteridinediphosphokinase [Paracoccus isoporae]|uniref:2-amino-4-hydroxy-6-hydroxymethyldihydropteridine pyrophosphokinase n=1 Tax=Paracoccus isoporae TaxID=591205 RepID=A0A1G7AJL9_9RHOB|nr:2-amino-4-hydroxy-6-hydroxymethyldihydropteridine diphosphokinase [Paracoccus isoporae]SDE14667.1 2-amino-4-hydroxy-6-hydroxymethyldihydropteridinediphosphokinase [Paracoccus isoporae]
MPSKLVLIALGANLSSSAGSPAKTLKAALISLAAHPGLTLRQVSRFYATPAHPAGSGPDYVNACAALDAATATAGAVLGVLHELEANLGRIRDGGRWAARGIDLDLLAMEDQILPDRATQDRWRGLDPERQARIAPDRLILPHPRMQDRGFVLVPLAEIAAGWRHPATGQSVAEMRDALPVSARRDIRVLLDNPGESDHNAASALL